MTPAIEAAKAELELLSPPGDTILETMEAVGLTRPQLANAMFLDTDRLDGLISGEGCIDLDIANRLEVALNIPAQFWLNRENIYRHKREVIEAELRGFESRQGEVDALKDDIRQLEAAILSWEKHSMENE